MQHEGPVYLRLSRMLVPEVHGEAYHFEMGRAVVLRPGKDVTLAANGTMVWRCLEAARQLEAEGVDARVLNVCTLKPLDRHALEAAARETGGIVTVEEHTLAGGLGSAVAEVVVSSHPVAMRMLGIPGVFAPTGSAAWLMEFFGLTPERIGAAAKELLS
jgi:transketolase